MSRKLHTKSLPISLIILASTVIIIIAFFLFQNLQKQQAQTSTITNQTINWETYKNVDYGYKIDYPEFFRYQTSLDPKRVTLHGQMNNNHRTINISIDSGNGDNVTQPIDTWIQKHYPNQTIEKVQIGGVTTSSITLPATTTYGKAVNHYFLHNNIVYKISVSMLVEESKEEAFAETETLVNQLLSTFQFTE